MALTQKQTEKLRELIREEIDLRFKVNSNNKKEISKEKLQIRKSKLLEIFNNQILINSITKGNEAPSRITDFVDRVFHERMRLL